MKIILEKNDSKFIRLTMITLLLITITCVNVFDNHGVAALTLGIFGTLGFTFIDVLDEVTSP